MRPLVFEIFKFPSHEGAICWVNIYSKLASSLAKLRGIPEGIVHFVLPRLVMEKDARQASVCFPSSIIIKLLQIQVFPSGLNQISRT
jgi:hypothetical protein